MRERASEYIVGVLESCDPLAVVVPQDLRIRHDLFVTQKGALAASVGDVVLARITSYPSRRTAMEGYIVEVLGRADAPGMDVDVIIHNAGLATEFSPQAQQQAAGITLDLEAALAERGRRDLRQRDIFTIDPAGAKDFDDALSLERVEGMWRLGVHIADVSSYVAAGSSIDICARDRGCSVYLADRVLPMLPEVLSNDICSLFPGQDRLTMTCDMYLDETAQVKRYEIYPSIINSARRYTYDEVQAVLDAQAAGRAEGTGDNTAALSPNPRAEAPGENAAPLLDPRGEKLAQLSALAKQLASLREQRGGLEFATAEAKPVLDEAGKPVRIDVRTKTEATLLVEEAMILANETVARHLFAARRPAVYRIHEPPRLAALEVLLPVLKGLGYSIEGLGAGEPRAYQQIMRTAKGKPEQGLVTSMLLRSMEQARYSTNPQGHFGLALEHYCHFTSPIRRYPDLMVHRLLKDPQAMQGNLDWLASHASKMERVAEEAENESIALKLCEFMAQHVGEEYEGVICSVLAEGFYVRLPNTTEGLVRLDCLHGEQFFYDPKLQTLAGEETGRVYRLGQQVRILVDQVDVRQRHIDFALA